MENKDLEPSKRSEQDQIGVLCLTVLGIFILLVLRVQLSNDIAALIPLAELVCQVRSQLHKKK